MKVHIEYDDFGEYLEACVDGEFYVMEDYGERKGAELFLFGDQASA